MNPQKIAVITDSCADLYPEYREGKPIFVVPLRIRCQDGEYEDGVNIFAPDIYQYLKSELPKTSLPAGEAFENTLRRIREQGYERVIAVMLSSGLSGTYNMMRVAGENFPGLEVATFDSISGSLGVGMIVLRVVEYIEQGMSWEEILDRVPKLIANVTVFFSVDTLEYLQKGGRIGKITALAGSLLNIKPIITFAPDGQLTTAAKVRGRKQIQSRLVELVADSLGDHPHYVIGMAHGGAPEEMEELRQKLAQRFPQAERSFDAHIDATLSVYIGPGVLGAGVLRLE